MDDLLKQIEEIDTYTVPEQYKIRWKAMNEIERLRKKHNRLRLALEDIADFDGGDVTKLWKEMRSIARAALKEDE